MIVVEQPRNLETSGNITPSNFRIKASKKAFEILSSGLYSDKIKAIVRELSTNAADSHTAAGKPDVPFTVHLPNSLEPYFSVKDDGVGLSEEQVNGIYTTYFDSDKTHSNDLTGCLGLGSKSPFSYTEQFTVETRFGGVKYTFNCFINESGVPSVAKLCEQPTDEANGVEVKFPVKPADFNEFRYKAEEALSWFRVRPKVVGNASFHFKDVTYMRRTEKYGLRQERSYNSYVVMGNVAYACKPNDLRSSSTTLTDLERKVMEWGCDLFVPIGSIEITASREEVSYDPRTVAVVKESLVAAVEDIKKEVENMIVSAPTLWQARRALHDARHSILGQIRDVMQVEWQGQKIQDHVDVRRWNGKQVEEAKAAYRKKMEEDAALQGVTLAPLSPYDRIDLPFPVSQAKVESVSLKKTKFRKTDCDTIHADGKLIFLDDLDKGGYVRMVNYLNENNKEQAYYITLAPGAFLTETGIGEVVIRTSTLPKPERKQTTSVPRRQGSKAKLNEYKPDCHSNSAADYWTPAEVDLADGGIYVEILYFRWRKTVEVTESTSEDGVRGTEHPNDLREIVEILRSLGYNEKIYGIRPADTKILAKHEGWISLEAFIDAVLAENEELESVVAKARQWQNISNRHLHRFFSRQFRPESVFGKLTTLAAECKKAADNDKAKSYCRLANKYQRPLPEGEETLSTLETAVSERYPLLSHLNWWHADEGNGFMDAVTGYIDAIDAK
jgi:hypothetical protein